MKTERKFQFHSEFQSGSNSISSPNGKYVGHLVGDHIVIRTKSKAQPQSSSSSSSSSSNFFTDNNALLACPSEPSHIAWSPCSGYLLATYAHGQSADVFCALRGRLFSTIRVSQPSDRFGLVCWGPARSNALLTTSTDWLDLTCWHLASGSCTPVPFGLPLKHVARGLAVSDRHQLVAVMLRDRVADADAVGIFACFQEKGSLNIGPLYSGVLPRKECCFDHLAFSPGAAPWLLAFNRMQHVNRMTTSSVPREQQVPIHVKTGTIKKGGAAPNKCAVSQTKSFGAAIFSPTAQLVRTFSFPDALSNVQWQPGAADRPQLLAATKAGGFHLFDPLCVGEFPPQPLAMDQLKRRERREGRKVAAEAPVVLVEQSLMEQRTIARISPRERPLLVDTKTAPVSCTWSPSGTEAITVHGARKQQLVYHEVDSATQRMRVIHELHLLDPILSVAFHPFLNFALVLTQNVQGVHLISATSLQFVNWPRICQKEQFLPKSIRWSPSINHIAHVQGTIQKDALKHRSLQIHLLSVK